MSQQPDLHDVDWSKIPAPEDDGAADHLEEMTVPDVSLPATDGSQVSLREARRAHGRLRLSADRPAGK